VIRLTLLTLIASFLLFLSNPAACRAELSEDAITSIFLSNVLGYVEWTGTSPAAYTICMAADDEMKNTLRNHLATRKSGNNISMRSLDTSRDTSGCSAVYIDEFSNPKGISYIINNAREQQVLTIGNGADFIKQGGLIQLKFEKRKLVLSLNRTASQDYRINFNPRLVSLARHVR
jgi:hypothetical protein